MYHSRLKAFRIKKGITLEELSELSEVSAGYLCHLENGTRKNPSIEVMEKIAKALNTNIFEIFFKE